MKLYKCNYLDDSALPMLAVVKDSLVDLELSSCGNITDDGVKSLAALNKLQHLLLFDLPEVNGKDGCLHVLRSALPECNIEFPYAQASELKKSKENGG